MTKKQKTEKIEEILCTIVAILSVRVAFIFILGFTPLANYIGVQYENQYYNKYIYAEGQASECILDETQKAIDNVPQSLLSFFYENGGMVNVTNEGYESTYNYKNDIIKFRVAGFFRHKGEEEYSIYIINNLNNIMYGTVEHEFGHYLDFLFDDISSDKLFKNAYLEEYQDFKEHIESNNYYDNQSEYFAESFSYYLNEPKKLEKYCPQTYNVFEWLVDIVNDCCEISSP